MMCSRVFSLHGFLACLSFEDDEEGEEFLDGDIFQYVEIGGRRGL